MKFLLFLLIILYCFSLFARTEQSIFNQVSPLIFQIKTSTDETSSKASYGSGFVVEKNGLLVTNYHVVSMSLQEEDPKYNIYVMIDEKPISAQVVAVDVIHDLALIKIDYNFKKDLKLSKKIPLVGETILSMGLPKDLKLSLVKGTYNGVLKYSVYEQILMSSPINSGMSGGPTFNLKAEVIGVNVSVLRQSQNISFCVPIIHVFNLLSMYRQNYFKDLTKNIHGYIKKQLIEIEKNLMEDLLKGKGENNKLDKWIFAPPSSNLKCWSKTDKDKNKTYEYKQQSCHLPADAYLKDNLSSGNYNLYFFSSTNLKRTKVQYYNMLESFYNSTSYYFREETPFSTNKEIITPFECEQMILVNKHQIPFKINLCLNTFMKLDGLYNIIIKGVSLLKSDDAFLFVYYLQGFSKLSIDQFLNYQIDQINYEDAP